MTSNSSGDLDCIVRCRRARRVIYPFGLRAKKENLSQPKSYTILFASLVVLKRPFVTPRPFCRLSPSEMHGVNCLIWLSARSETRFPGKAFSGFSPRRLTRRKPQREHRTLKTATRPVRCVAGLTQNTHLSELRVRNFALVDEQYVHFHPGLNVIHRAVRKRQIRIARCCLSQLCGAPAREESIRTGEECAVIEGTLSKR